MPDLEPCICERQPRLQHDSHCPRKTHGPSPNVPLDAAYGPRSQRTGPRGTLAHASPSWRFHLQGGTLGAPFEIFQRFASASGYYGPDDNGEGLIAHIGLMQSELSARRALEIGGKFPVSGGGGTFGGWEFPNDATPYEAFDRIATAAGYAGDGLGDALIAKIEETRFALAMTMDYLREQALFHREGAIMKGSAVGATCFPPEEVVRAVQDLRGPPFHDPHPPHSLEEVFETFDRITKPIGWWARLRIRWREWRADR